MSTGTITLTAAMRANLLSLQQTGNQLSTTQLALSTGNKVNSALDNPVNFFAAQSLNRRASSLSALLDGMGQDIQALQTANQGITSITSLVNQLTSIVQSAQTDLKNVTKQDILQTSGGANSGIDSTLVGDLTANGGITANDSFTLQDGANGAVHTFTITAGETLDQLVTAINQVQGFNASIVYGDGTTQSASTVTAGAAAGGAMQVGQAYLTVVSSDNKAITAANGALDAATPLTTLGLGVASTAPTVGGAAGDDANWASVIGQINQLAADTSYQGNNLINNNTTGVLSVQVNELNQGSISIDGKDCTQSGLGLAATQAFTSGSDFKAINATITSALNSLQANATSFANSLSLLQNRQDFTTNLVNTLQDGASQLTIADKNEEGANLLALQTQQQLGIEALSLSSQANQSVLRLFA